MSENNAAPAKAVNPSLYKSTTIYLFLGYFMWPFSLIGLKLEREDDFIRFHCAQGMAFFFLQAAIGILYGIAAALVFVVIGILMMPFVIALYIASYVFMILAIVKAAKGERYMMPVLGNIAESSIKKWFSK
jgi:uncharacterized membrane protein